MFDPPVEAYVQQYIALRALGAPDPTVASALNQLRELVEAEPDPALWLTGLEMADGSQPPVPAHFRIEISTPEPGVIVIQCIGVRWDPAGHLAYALAIRLMTELGDKAAFAFEPDYGYYRDQTRMLSTRHFLDNTVHLIEAAPL